MTATTPSTPTAIVTGASSGLGRALAADLAAAGWNVVVDARHAPALEEAVTAARAGAAPGTTVQAVVGDVGDADHRRALMAAADALGGVDLLVANAGTLGPSPLPPLAALPLAELERTLRTNVVAQVGLVQEALPALRAAAGTLVVVTSDAAVEGYEGWGAYGASKAALEQVAHVLAAEESAVRVYRFDPGDMRTPMHQDAFPGEDISDRHEPETVVPALRRLLFDRPPSGRYRAADLTEAVPAQEGRR
jgi:NAD(P)-dependent dehydrogenase (short-subunit alcohol dehydrogenase family)